MAKQSEMKSKLYAKQKVVGIPRLFDCDIQ